MKKGKLLVLLLVIGILLVGTSLSSQMKGGNILSVPGDYSTIMAAIDAASDGDEVIVSPGVYQENLDFKGKHITVASFFYTTKDTSYIRETVIDGGGFDSVVKFVSGENEKSKLAGFRLTGGKAVWGGGIYMKDSGESGPVLTNLLIDNCESSWEGSAIFSHNSTGELSDSVIRENSTPREGTIYCERGGNLHLKNVVIEQNQGGGIYCMVDDSPILENVIIRNNKGGGIIQNTGSSPILRNVLIEGNSGIGINSGVASNPYLENVTIRNNQGGGISVSPEYTFCEEAGKRCNIYDNSSGNFRGDIAAWGEVEVILDTFSVLRPTSWYLSGRGEVHWDILHGKHQQVQADLYVSPYGDNNNSGRQPEEPLQSIDKACRIIWADSANVRTIHLAAGVYSPSVNAEMFPVRLPEYVILAGESKHNVILDAEEEGSVVSFDNVKGCMLKHLTLTGGKARKGAGIWCRSTALVLEHLIIKANHSTDSGGGIYSSLSDLTLTRVVLAENQAGIGGGLSGLDSDYRLMNVTFYGNSADTQGGGIWGSGDSNFYLLNCIMWDDAPQEIELSFVPQIKMSIACSDISGGEKGIITHSMTSIVGQYLDADDYERQHAIKSWGEGNIDSDPLFINATDGDFRLQRESGCIESGTASYTWEGDIILEIEEYYGEKPEIGAVEFID
ncbi:MAG: right-handed parallel beta-helix repeat-containing protein [Candidatus Cloacimonetes bacterium]|nr:right-handed parallel beta-helix repeat-containing protein [Candidatus Cloacimonadota bacterium]